PAACTSVPSAVSVVVHPTNSDVVQRRADKGEGRGHITHRAATLITRDPARYVARRPSSRRRGRAACDREVSRPHSGLSPSTARASRNTTGATSSGLRLAPASVSYVWKLVRVNRTSIASSSGP